MEYNLKDIKKEYVGYLRRPKKNVCNWKLDINDRILLLGGSGFLGIYLLRFLLLRGTREVFLLSRNVKTCENIYKYFSEIFGPDSSEDLNRVKFITGDISYGDLKLNNKDLSEILKKVDVIINLAAKTDSYGDINEFFYTNVIGTLNVIHLMKKSKRPVELYHISTLGICEGMNHKKEYSFMSEFTWRVDRDYSLLDVNKNYYLTKNYAERIIARFVKKGERINIIRLGNVGCNSLTGEYCIQNLSTSILKLIGSFCKIGVFPSDSEWKFDFMPVDNLVDALARIIANRDVLGSGNIYHLSNGKTYSLLSIGENISQYSDISFVSKNELEEKIKKLDTSNTYKNEVKIIQESYLVNYDERMTKTIVGTEFTTNILAQMNFKWKEFGNYTIEKYIKNSFK